MKGKKGPRPVSMEEARSKGKAADEAFRTGRIECRFTGITMRLASEDKKTAALSFSVVLDETIAERLPGPVLENFKHLRKTTSQASEVDVEAGAIPAQNWKFYQWPERGAAQHVMDAVAPEKVALNKDKKAGTVSLHWTLTKDLHEDTWQFMKQFGNTIWFDFEEAQMTLDEAAGKAKAAGAED